MPVGRLGALCVVAGLLTACAAPIQRPATVSAPTLRGLAEQTPVSREGLGGRPTVGVAFGGGSARGIAHVGVIRWFEEHRIPIDLAAGTSMGGLIGGSFATGMNADELEAMLATIDWDVMFGSSGFRFKNIRRKTDARAFPSRLEFGLKRGLVPPTSLNNGEEVELLLRRITAPYGELPHFDALPTPFRAVAVDLVSATEVVLDRGSLAQAMRATMSLPLIFPPVDLDGRVLVDGGAMNNVPSDVVKAMGADRVIAVNVGDLADREGISYTLLGLAGATLDAMMRASTKYSIAAADVIVDVPLKGFGSLDWRRGDDLMAAGYQAAEAMREQLLPFAIGEAEYAQWRERRAARRRRELAVPGFTRIEGFARNDERRLETLLAKHVGVPLDIASLERDLNELTGLDRYETITWRMTPAPDGAVGLVVSGRVKSYAPPFMMLGLNLENTTSSDFRITTTARYLGYGLISSGSELRLDGTIGSNPAASVELYEPVPSTPLFAAPYANITTAAATSLAGDRILARYGITTSRLGLNVGVNLGARSDLRVGAFVGRVTASIEVGTLGLPELRGKESGAELLWRYDTQDSPVVPSTGTRFGLRLVRMFEGPDVIVNEQTVPLDGRVTQLSGTVNRFWSVGERHRVFVAGGFGTSFRRTALPTNTFTLGSPLSLGAYRVGELRGSHSYLGTTGVMRQIGRLPDFLGGPMFVGAWIENGDAFEDWSAATWRTNASTGLILDTLLGPVILAGSGGFDGRWRTYIGVGRIFR